MGQGEIVDGIAVSGDAAGSPSHVIGVLVCGGAAGCSDATENCGVPFHDAPLAACRTRGASDR